jgi:hypothetical protein
MTQQIKIRARAAADGSTAPEPGERIAAIAFRVRRPAAYATAQEADRDLATRHVALRNEERDLIQQMLEGGGESNASGALIRRIRELDGQLSMVSDSLKVALETLFEAREPFARAISEALAPERRASARRALAAAETLISEFELQDLIDRK